jgi:hypothetical protein
MRARNVLSFFLPSFNSSCVHMRAKIIDTTPPKHYKKRDENAYIQAKPSMACLHWALHWHCCNDLSRKQASQA